MLDTIIIGGGQSGLATAYYLKREGLNFLLLDEQEQPGGAWQHAWESLRLFSPADASSLPGWLMPKGEHTYPSRQEAVEYLQKYEARYKFPVERPVQVLRVFWEDDHFRLETSKGEYRAKTLVSATGTYSKPYIPPYPGREHFQGQQLHSADYKTAGPFQGKTVMVVGGGNSGAQILAEVSTVAQTLWVTEQAPGFLPDEVDGRYLFSVASKMWEARQRGETYMPKGSLAAIVMVDPVKDARARGVLQAQEPFDRFTSTGVVWSDGRSATLNAVIWCTGFRPALEHLQALHVVEADGKVQTRETRCRTLNSLWLVGYGSWTGFASATLIGVGRTARQTAAEIKKHLQA